MRAFVERGFDLGRDASLRGCLICEGGERHILALVAHHGAADGSSVAVLCSELGAFYEACLDSREAGLAPLPYQYSDHARWQRESLEGSGELERGLHYWTEHLRGAPEHLELPSDRPRRDDRARRAGYERFEADAGLRRGLEDVAGRHGTTLFSVLLAGFGVLLGRLSRQDEVVIGTPVAGRGGDASECLIGFS